MSNQMRISNAARRFVENQIDVMYACGDTQDSAYLRALLDAYDKNLQPDAFREDNGDKDRANPVEAPTQSNPDCLIELLDELQAAEANYRYCHDHYGGRDSKSGRAWDLMRRCGDRARTELKK